MTIFNRTLLTAMLVIVLPACVFAGEVVVPFMSGQAEFTNMENGQVRIQIPDFSSEISPGDPELPFTSSYVLLPPNADLHTIRVELRNAVEEKVDGIFSVMPTPPAVTYIDDKKIEDWGSGKDILNGHNELVYKKDALYPADYATLEYGQRLANYQLVPIHFWPYRYNPVTGIITHLVSADVAVIFESLPIAAAAGASMDEDRLRGLAINWQQASQWYGSPVKTMEATSSTGLAIITTSAIANASTKLNDFIAHKTNMGFAVTLVTESQWGGGTGNTAAENLRNWLKANYLNQFRYVLLIGNPDPSTGDVPMKMTWPRHGETDGYETAPTDYYYADLTGNWDLNGNGYYGENTDFGVGGIDRVPEVLVGRIPYYDVIADLDKILQKIISYESATTIGGWAQKILLPMKPLDDSTPMYHLGEAIKNNTAIPAGFSYCRIYESTYGLNPAPEITPCNDSNVLAEWQKHYGYVFWNTHGNETFASGILSSSNCPNLDDAYPSVVFQGSCLNGKPENSSNLGYSLLRNGAINTISASRVSWYYPGQTNFVNSDSDPGMAYTYALKAAKERQRAGDALFNMKTGCGSVSIWMNHVVFNLYGDPTTKPPWPTSFVIEPFSLPDATVSKGYSASVLHATGGTPPYKWTLASGALPSGLYMTTAGTIYGTPSKSGIYHFTVKVTDNAGASLTSDATLAVVQTVHSFTFDTDPGWECQGAWAYGTPSGSGSHNVDPTVGYTGNTFYGYNLAGDYSNNISTPQYLTTQAIDCSMIASTSLSFWRWLGVEGSAYDHAAVQVSNDDSTWTTIWNNPSTSIQDTSWTQQVFDISAVADGQPNVYIRWEMGATDSSQAYCGWNIDDVEITGALTKPLIKHTPNPDTDITTGFYKINADVTFAGTALSGNPVLHWSNGGSFLDYPMSKLTTSGNTYRAYVAAQPSGTTIRYYFTAADTVGASTLPINAPTNCFQFNIITDTQPPAISHTPLADTTDTSGTYPVIATVTDNLGVSTVNLTWTKDSGTPTTLAMTRIANSDQYQAVIQTPAKPGDWINYKITATDTSVSHIQSTNPSSGWNTFNILPGRTKIYNFDLSTNPGWACQGSWAYGMPTGTGSGKKDPTSGHTGNSVYGYNLSGDYINAMTTTDYLTTSALDLTGISNTALTFWRWLGVEKSRYDHANIQVSSDGIKWTDIWSNDSDANTDDGAWTQQSYNISATADGQPTVYIRWGMGTTDSSISYCGWNIDDITISGDRYVQIDNISILKSKPDFTCCRIDNCVVTAAFNGFFYAQDPADYQGIKVIWPGAVTEGSKVTLEGVIRTRNGERELLAGALQ